MINDKLIYAYNIFRSNIITFISLIIIIFIIIVALLAPYISPYDPLLTATEEKLLPPSFKHLFGTDQLGRDILSRIIYATRLDLYIAVSAVIISFAIGTTIGSLAGYYSGLIDTIVGRIVDTIMAFPLFVIASRSLSTSSSKKIIPIIRTRGTTRPIKKHWLNRKMHTDWTDYFITAGDVVKERLLKNVDISKDNLKTIYYPVLSPVLPLKPLRDYRYEFNIKKNSQIFAVVGRIRSIKVQRILL